MRAPKTPVSTGTPSSAAGYDVVVIEPMDLKGGRPAEGAVFPPGAWQVCAGTPEFQPGERVWVGVDLSGGGGRSDTAVVWLNERLHVGVEVWSGAHDPSAEVADFVGELADRYRIVELVLDFWRASQPASELEQRSLVVVSYPQTDSRLSPRLSASTTPCSNSASSTRTTRASTPTYTPRSAARADADGGSTGRGRVQASKVDGVLALAMAVYRASFKPAEVKLLGWL